MSGPDRDVAPPLFIPAVSTLCLSWDYDAAHPQIQRLLDEGRRQQWADVDIGWQRDEPPVAVDQAAFGRTAFARSPLARYGPDLWDRFRHEQQTWMVSQFLHGEQGALVVSARLAEVLPDIAAKSYAATQAAEEARHVAVFARYSAERLPTRYPLSPSVGRLLSQILADRRWDFLALGMHVMIEALALGAFRLASSSFEDPLIRRITHLTSRDEARHVAFGILLLDGVYDTMTDTERREREDFVLEAADLLSRRYLLTEVWERLGVDRRAGTAFSATNEMMRAYRTTIFGRVVHTLRGVGLMTPRVQAGFASLGLVR
jgi:hypothetical protein